ncbi:unnamed protein product [Rotaria sp. Silwood2]|nr:unnamed protein product [Rotaria sp. Silwood2]CAF3310614.1 unnamed protein product [Rotaria sp. Silwood2]CAF4258268.1 unnamed protein product [Rotaria sp. Silwood2]CAF4339769.1 unnamed protein product [Rotaria sp. Silwood2]
MISTNGLKRKSSTSVVTDNNNIITNITTKRFRGTSYDGKIHHNEHQKSLLLSTNKSQQSTKMTIHNSKQEMTSEYRQLQYELQCQEALLVLMQKLKTNQRILSQTNNTNQRTTTTTTAAATPVNTTKLNSTTSTKQSSNLTNRSTPIKQPHPNQYTVNRSNNNLQQQSSSKPSQSLPQATRQSTNSTLPPTAATRLSSTISSSTTKNSSLTSTTNNSLKNNGISTDQHLFNAKLALRKQLEQTLLQIPTPKPTTCDLTYIPGINGWAEFLTMIGLEQAYNTYTDIINRRFTSEFSMMSPYVCAQCGTDWSVTWHDILSTNDNEKDEKILCDRCRKTSQKKILKQDHSNRLRQAFMKALQQEKELDAKFQQQSSTTVKQSTSSSSSSSHHKPSNKSLTTKINSNHQSNKHTNNNNNNNHHHHSGKTSSSKHLTTPPDTFASALAALPTNEQIELFQKHFLSNMFPFAVANQAAALATKTTQQQQQALAASLPAMAASLMRQGNPAQYLLDMIPQAAKQQQQQQQQQQHHHRHSK